MLSIPDDVGESTPLRGHYQRRSSASYAPIPQSEKVRLSAGIIRGGPTPTCATFPPSEKVRLSAGIISRRHSS